MKEMPKTEAEDFFSYDIDAVSMPKVFGIRHLSPAGAFYLRKYLDRCKPKRILIEGPSDFNPFIGEIIRSDVLPPIAIMSYTLEAPIRTILYPFAEYSPEYQAMRWADEHGCKCLFCDLPSDIFLGIGEENEKIFLKELEKKNEGKEGGEEGEKREDIYAMLDGLCEDKDHESFWERTLEQAGDMYGYIRGAAGFGANLRDLSLGRSREDAENLVREAYMRRILKAALAEGIAPEDIVMLVGAFHVEGIIEGLKKDFPAMSDKELASLPRLPAKSTLMPYSYYRLSQRSGYGAGNRAPAYYELVWKGLCRGESEYASLTYLSELGAFQREYGFLVSSAQIIEALRLARELARLQGGRIPVLRDLNDAALTCLAQGEFGKLAQASAAAQIGTKIGSVPEGVSRTSIQSDFYGSLKSLKLEKYKSLTAEELALDLRENLRVKSEESAFLDLNRSFFLHRLRVLKIEFAKLLPSAQDKATWAENWMLQWTPEAEIQLIEAVLKGDTIEQALAFVFNENLEAASSISELAHMIEETFYCGMPKSLERAVNALQKTAVDAVAITEIAPACASLSMILGFGDIRKLDRSPLEPILSQLFLRACLVLPQESACDDAAGKLLAEALIVLHGVVVNHEFLDSGRWYALLSELAGRDDLNTRISGLAAAILLEAGKMDKEELGREMERRLSKGIPADLGAGWFEGLSMKNHYALIARLVLWERLSAYLDELDDEEFKRSLVFLRRAFADFNAEEKHRIAENLAEIWQVGSNQLSEALNRALGQSEMEALSELNEFDFGDI